MSIVCTSVREHISEIICNKYASPIKANSHLHTRQDKTVAPASRPHRRDAGQAGSYA